MILVPNLKHSDDDYKKSGNFRLRRLSSTEAEKLKESVSTAVKNSPIGEKYIKDLIEQVAINTKSEVVSTSILNLFKLVYESRGDDPLYGGMWVILNNSIGSFAVNHWMWVGGKGSAELLLGPPIEVNLRDFQKMNPEEQISARHVGLLNFISSPQAGGMTTIHELMHVAVKGLVKKSGNWDSSGDDIDYADAAADLAGQKRPVYIPPEAVLYPIPIPYGNPLLPSHILIGKKNFAASSYWGQRLNQACGYPSHLDNKTITRFKLYKEENK